MLHWEQMKVFPHSFVFSCLSLGRTAYKVSAQSLLICALLWLCPICPPLSVLPLTSKVPFLRVPCSPGARAALTELWPFTYSPCPNDVNSFADASTDFIDT